MLVLSRKEQERIHIGDSIVVTVVAIKGGKCLVGISAPDDTKIVRHEVLEVVKQSKERFAKGDDQ